MRRTVRMAGQHDDDNNNYQHKPTTTTTMMQALRAFVETFFWHGVPCHGAIDRTRAKHVAFQQNLTGSIHKVLSQRIHETQTRHG
mmetsp:Transcript_9211/g.17557  ORF Transcript_9211/g.17557 Transcript_9211/m.17557 type:complete len:85 (+) Transcript_9211:1031-1285(+)